MIVNIILPTGERPQYRVVPGLYDQCNKPNSCRTANLQYSVSGIHSRDARVCSAYKPGCLSDVCLCETDIH